MLRLRFLLTCSLLVLNFSCLPIHSGEPAAMASPSASSTPQSDASPIALPVLNIKTTRLRVELACTPAEQQQGLMFRRELPEDQGMLFVFPQEQRLSFWMKNTYVPLSIAYLDNQGTVVDIQDMEPLDLEPHPSAKLARYALEVNQGWFQRHQVVVGDVIALDSFCAHRRP